MKKIISLLLVIALTAALSIAGTLAYLTDMDSETNVFTVGNVDIEVQEDFKQNSVLTPGEDVNKDVQIKNIGSNAAWVWYTYAIPAALDTPVDASGNVLHVNHAGANWLDYREDPKYWADDQTAATPENQCWIPDYNPEGNGKPIGTVTKDGIEYNVYAVLYNGVLKTGEITTIGMTKVYLDTKLDVVKIVDEETNETVTKWYLVENGEMKYIDWNPANNPEIIVTAYAIQADGFKTVQEAYAAYQAQWEAEA